MRDAVAEALPAIVEAERVAEENAVRERDGDSAVSGWFEAAGAEAGPIADACADSLSIALRNTGHTTEALVSNLYPERDDAA